jgi:hypothetical protein
MKYILIAYLTAAFCVVATADEVKLANGRTLTGIASREESGRVLVVTRYGDLRFPESEVQSIEPGRSDLHEYQEKLDALGPCPAAADVFALAQWAQERGLTRYVNGLLTQTIELEPDHAEARALLGYVQFEGNWMFKSQKDSILAFRESEHRTVVEKRRKTVPVRRTTPQPEETPYSLGLPLVPNRSTTDVYPARSGGYSSGGGYIMSIGGVTPGGDVVIPYPIGGRAGVRTGTTTGTTGTSTGVYGTR